MQLEQQQLLYADDEQIDIKEYVKNNENKKLNYDIDKQLNLTVTSLQKVFKLSSNKTQTIPVQIAIATEVNKDQEKDLNNRPSIDLICVIDKSGSMQGQKIELVRETLKTLIQLLNDNDRLSLVEFESSARRIIPLTSCKKQNHNNITAQINRLQASGGTTISEGLKHAFQIIQQRKIKNQVTSIFLLSDGQDKSAGQRIKQLMVDMNFEETLTIHSFGFGNDHDPVLMNEISQLKDGNFYYVQKLSEVDEMFIDALGGLFSVVAQDIDIKVKVNHDNKTFADNQVQKTYGDMWVYNKNLNEYSIKLQQLISGVSKEYLLELEIPPVSEKVGDHERNTVFLNAILSAKGIGAEKDKTVTKQAGLEITIYNEDENIVPDINEEVELNVLRVRGAEAMQQAQKLAEQGNYQQGQQLLQKAQQQIQFAKPQQQQQLQMLNNDIIESEKNCTSGLYAQQGKNLMVQNQRQHYEKRSKGNNNQYDMYSNSNQKQMVQQQQMQKPIDQQQMMMNYQQQQQFQNQKMMNQQQLFSQQQQQIIQLPQVLQKPSVLSNPNNMSNAQVQQQQDLFGNQFNYNQNSQQNTQTFQDQFGQFQTKPIQPNMSNAQVQQLQNTQTFQQIPQVPVIQQISPQTNLSNQQQQIPQQIQQQPQQIQQIDQQVQGNPQQVQLQQNLETLIQKPEEQNSKQI